MKKQIVVIHDTLSTVRVIMDVVTVIVAPSDRNQLAITKYVAADADGNVAMIFPDMIKQVLTDIELQMVRDLSAAQARRLIALRNSII